MYKKLIILVTFVVLVSSCQSYRDTSQKYEKLDIIKTVAHISLDGEWELIYEDIDNDIAYYKYIGTRTSVKTGDIVINEHNKEFKVIGVYNEGFYIEYNDNFYPGMSGTIIRDKQGKEVGIVSTLINSEYIKCIYSIYL